MTPLPRREHVSPTTFHGTGVPVATEVRTAADGDTLVVWTRAGPTAPRLRADVRVRRGDVPAVHRLLRREGERTS